MSLSSTTQRNDYTGNAAVSVYAYSFKIFDQSHLEVKVLDTDGNETTLVITTDYTVSGVGATSGGNVTLVNASQAWLTAGKLKTDYHLSIRRQVPLKQETDIRNQGSFFPETHEDALDYRTMVEQQLQDGIDRSFHLPSSIDPDDFDTALPSDVQEHAGEMIIVNAASDGLEFGGDPANVPLYYIQGTPPTNPSAVRLAFWYDTSVEQMKIWDGTAWRLIA